MGCKCIWSAELHYNSHIIMADVVEALNILCVAEIAIRVEPYGQIYGMNIQKLTASGHLHISANVIRQANS